VLLWWDWRRRDCLGFDGRLLSFGCLLPFPLSTERCCQGFRGERLRPLLGISMARLPNTFGICSID
jgi:hypothetical protein